MKGQLATVTAVLVAIVAMIAVTGTVVAVVALSDAHSASAEAVEASNTALRETHEIAASRRHAIEEACAIQNKRHTKALRQLKAFVAKSQKAASKAERAKAHVVLRVLVNALVPAENCKAKLARQTSP